MTGAGRQRYATVNERSEREVAQLLEENNADEVIEAMRALRSALEPERNVEIRGLEPGGLGWLVERHGVLYARVRLGSELRAARGEHRRRLRPGRRPRLGRDRQRPARRRHPLCPPQRDHGPTPHPARRAARARPRSRHPPRRRGHPSREDKRIRDPRAVDQRRAARRAPPSTSAPGSRSRTRRRITRSATTSPSRPGQRPTTWTETS